MLYILDDSGAWLTSLMLSDSFRIFISHPCTGKNLWGGVGVPGCFHEICVFKQAKCCPCSHLSHVSGHETD